MNGPHFSLALPILNGLPGLRRCVEALKRQTYQDFDLVVQDGGSTDGSLDFLRDAALPHIDIVSEPDTGIAQGYSRALSRCRGPLVVFLACDEWLEDNALEIFCRWYANNPSAAVCFGALRMWRTATEVASVFRPAKFELWRFMDSECSPTIAGFFNKEVIGADLYMDGSLKTCPDFDLFIRLGLRFGNKEIVDQPEIVQNNMMDQTSATFRPSTFPQFARDRVFILKRVFKEQGNSPLMQHLQDVAISSTYAHLAACLWEITGETADVDRFIIEAAKYQPSSAKVLALVNRSRALLRDETTGQIFVRPIGHPVLPPSDAQVCDGIIDLRTIVTEAEWLATGAAASGNGAGSHVITGWPPWTPAAQIPLRLDETRACQYWIDLQATVRSGKVGIAVVTADDRLKDERLIAVGEPQTRVVLRVAPTDRAVLVRNASIDGPSEVDLNEARVLSVPSPHWQVTGADRGPGDGLVGIPAID